MEQNLLSGALSRLSERLAAFDQRVGHYCGYESTGKGITLQTMGCSLFLYPSFIYKLIYNPDSLTEEELAKVVSNFARFERGE